MSADLETVLEFKRRRKVTWDAVKWWVAIDSIGLIGMMLLGDIDESASLQRFAAPFVLFMLVGIAFIRIVYIVRANYRCPACEAIPMSTDFSVGPGIGYEEGVAINPKRCSACGARLG